MDTKAISNEFFCRARQWRDVAEFERKELLKVRVYKSLKLTSRAILVVTMNIIFLSVIDVEFYYSRFGELITPRRLYPTVTHPAGVFAPCHFNQTSAQPIMMSFSYFTRSLILFLTLCNMWLIWWYTELERRLLVARHHLQEQSSLLLGPLTTNLMIELVSYKMKSSMQLLLKEKYRKPLFKDPHRNYDES
ncbi:Oidioi.mRNA.OKI2018_I69.PAR.g11190.t1.cds [Oikopleura dioica]|uniref:Oidioi.mRNA.OKI2018_I69.PAR.g11190.t1.cds n=1 Tax=Oikopleura dioica TaxID=34765 RepID=A0ABN7RXT3_OIKDI|nr:Oidioi.mRNA.OKI2018_I69.PAR.g11190.t1.cds [Oikopleura dioica]